MLKSNSQDIKKSKKYISSGKGWTYWCKSNTKPTHTYIYKKSVEIKVDIDIHPLQLWGVPYRVLKNAPVARGGQNHVPVPVGIRNIWRKKLTSTPALIAHYVTAFL